MTEEELELAEKLFNKVFHESSVAFKVLDEAKKLNDMDTNKLRLAASGILMGASPAEGEKSLLDNWRIKSLGEALRNKGEKNENKLGIKTA